MPVPSENDLGVIGQHYSPWVNIDDYRYHVRRPTNKESPNFFKMLGLSLEDKSGSVLLFHRATL
jgi:hypothetical protein